MPGIIPETYNAAGNKLKQVTDSSGRLSSRYYYGAFEYCSTMALSLIHMEEGVVTKETGGYTYEYFLKDPLGNVCMVFKHGTTGPIVLQKTDYYPFGRAFSNQVNSSTDNKYLYNGKELQDYMQLDWYDYGARFYDPQIGRWHSQDPVLESTKALSPYCYVSNNPLNHNDPTGMKAAPVVQPEHVQWSSYMNYHLNDRGRLVFYESDDPWLESFLSSGGGHIAPDGYYYSWTDGTYHDKKTGRVVDWDEVYYNYVVPNSKLRIDIRIFANILKADNGAAHVGPKSTMSINSILNLLASLTYLRDFEGIAVFACDEFFKLQQGLTLPGLGIIINSKDKNSNDLLAHEFGHILQWDIWGTYYYYNVIAPASFDAAASYNVGLISYSNYLNTWTEWTANHFAFYYFKAQGSNIYTNWNPTDYPISPSNIQDAHARPNPGIQTFNEFYNGL